MANWNLESIFQALAGFISAIVFIYQKTKKSLLIEALWEKAEKAKFSEVKMIYLAKSIFVLGFAAGLAFINGLIFNIFFYVVLACIILISMFTISLIGIILLALNKLKEDSPVGELCILSIVVSFIFSSFIFLALCIIKIASGPIDKTIWYLMWWLFMLIIGIIEGYREYNYIKINAINRFLKKNTITASLCLRNKEKIKGRISQVEKDKVVISKAKTSTWINQKDILYLELFE